MFPNTATASEVLGSELEYTNFGGTQFMPLQLPLGRGEGMSKCLRGGFGIIHHKTMERRPCGNGFCRFLGLMFSSLNKKPDQRLTGGDVGGLKRKEKR